MLLFLAHQTYWDAQNFIYFISSVATVLTEEKRKKLSYIYWLRYLSFAEAILGFINQVVYLTALG